MKITTFLLLPAMVSASWLTGCSAINEVHDITSVTAGQPITGIPFRLADSYRVRVFKLAADGTYEEVHSEIRSMPDQEHIFAANFSAKATSDHEFKVELNPDNTLKTTSLKTTQKITDAANALADEVASNRTAREDRKTKEATAATTQRGLESTAVELKGKADVADAQLKAVLANPDATEVDRISAESALALAKKKANDAAIEAGLVTPFPGS